MYPIQTIASAAIVGIVPCLLWLIFWLREAHENPEPPKIILACFIGGMTATLLVFPFEYLVTLFLPSESLPALTIWAYMEEIAKFAIFWFIIIRTHKDHKPIDMVIYIIVVALGFSAFENTIYVLTPFVNGDFITGITTGGVRFMGATLLHTISSATVGVFIALAYFKKTHLKEEYAIVGLILAGLLHTLFNFFILDDSGSMTFLVFGTVWVLIILLIIVLEKIKAINNRCLIKIQNQ